MLRTGPGVLPVNQQQVAALAIQSVFRKQAVARQRAEAEPSMRQQEIRGQSSLRLSCHSKGVLRTLERRLRKQHPTLRLRPFRSKTLLVGDLCPV